MLESMALSDVLEEKKAQEVRWGKQNHEPPIWLMILGEEVGEANKAVLESSGNGAIQCNGFIKYRDEMVQVAAVALSAVESFDRVRKIKADAFMQAYQSNIEAQKSERER